MVYDAYLFSWFVPGKPVVFSRLNFGIYAKLLLYPVYLLWYIYAMNIDNFQANPNARQIIHHSSFYISLSLFKEWKSVSFSSIELHLWISGWVCFHGWNNCSTRQRTLHKPKRRIPCWWTSHKRPGRSWQSLGRGFWWNPDFLALLQQFDRYSYCRVDLIAIDCVTLAERQLMIKRDQSRIPMSGTDMSKLWRLPDLHE